jgi:CubicO group peptidase (beta-lactamase class C family)
VYLLIDPLDALGDASGSPNISPALPPLGPDDHARTCGAWEEQPGCDRQQTFELLLPSMPISPVWSSPMYSNTGFQLLGYALEKLTSLSFKESMKLLVFEPLGMSNSSVFAPAAEKGLIVSGAESYWNWSLGDEAP